LIDKCAPELVIECGGVGYEVQMPMTSFYQLADVGAEAVIFTHFVVREDAQLLYGFASLQERALFRELIKTNGVGPKMALAILSGLSADEFADSVTSENITRLTKIPGVGKKTAERLVVEMRDRLKNVTFNNAQNATVTVNAPSCFQAQVDPQDDAIAALESLGYKAAHASKVVAKVSEAGMSSEQIIKEALKAML
jgi:Holliday junction DNA helicase RuvA